MRKTSNHKNPVQKVSGGSHTKCNARY